MGTVYRYLYIFDECARERKNTYLVFGCEYFCTFWSAQVYLAMDFFFFRTFITLRMNSVYYSTLFEIINCELAFGTNDIPCRSWLKVVFCSEKWIFEKNCVVLLYEDWALTYLHTPVFWFFFTLNWNESGLHCFLALNMPFKLEWERFELLKTEKLIFLVN